MQTGKTVKFSIAACVRNFSLLLALCILPLIGAAVELYGLVIGVSDGDTIKVLDNSRQQHTIRLMGIDAPEKVQPFGLRSKQSLSQLVFDTQVTVQWFKRDKYGRIVGKVRSQDGRDICLEQISRGMAWHYAKYADEQLPADQEVYADAEKAARQSRLGLWQDPDPISPWVWRHPTTK